MSSSVGFLKNSTAGRLSRCQTVYMPGRYFEIILNEQLFEDAHFIFCFYR